MALDVLTGLTYVSISVVLWSLTPLLISMDSDSYSSFTANGLRALLAGLLLLPLSLGELLANPVKYLAAGTVIGLTGIVVGDSLYLLAIRRLRPSLAVVICYSYVATTLVFKQILLPGSRSLLAWIPVLIAVAGVYTAMYGRGMLLTVNRSGLIAALLANLFWAIWSILAWIYVGRLNLDVLALASSRLLVSGVLLLAYSIRRYGLTEVLVRAPMKLKYTMLTGLTGYLVGGTLYFESLKYIDVSQATIATAAVPVLSQAFSLKTGGRKVSRNELAGGVLVALSIALSVLYK